MGSPSARIVAARRSRARAYLVLSRVSNLPTVWSNVLAGAALASAGAPFPSTRSIVLLAAAVSLMYVAGMFLNDAFDARIDAAERPDRPVPAGDVSRDEAFAVGFALLLSGTLMLGVFDVRAVVWGASLAAAIVAYDYRHKGAPFGPLIMGLCRALVYCVAASAIAVVSMRVVAGAVVLMLYTMSLTWVARQVGARASVIVPLMIAGISLVDAAMIAWSGGGTLVPVAAAGFVLTLALQRVVPGT